MRYLKEPRTDPFSGDGVSDGVRETVADIIDDIETRGDEAALELTERFDGVARDSTVLGAEEEADAIDAVSDEEKRIIDNSLENVERFARAQRDQLEEFEIETGTGITLGERIVPVERVGAYVPGGSYPLLSSALMAVVPATVAGVPRVTAAMPPQDDGVPHPAAVYGAIEAGVDEIYVLGGAQAVASMALGTEEVGEVDMIVGPGNVFVTEAKRQLFGTVGIDLLAGPSEILVLADETADPECIAADLLAQAEHDTDARPLLVTTSERVGEETIEAIDSQLESLATADVAGESWREMGGVIVTDDLDEAVRLSDELAPEHLEVQTASPRRLRDELSNYGSLFLGEYSATVFSDKLIGTNHVLPTRRAARYTSGLSVHKFLKHQTFQEVTEEGAVALEPWATKQAVFERLEGHAKSSYIRNPDHDLSEFHEDDHDLPHE